jgi:Spy/CpxP family protein refolding chaperone
VTDANIPNVNKPIFEKTMILKKLSMIFLSVAALSFGAYAAIAQHGNPEEMIQKRLEHLKSALNLNDEQVSKIKSIYEQYEPALKADREAVRSASGDAQKQAAEQKMRREMEQMQTQVKTILTPEQQTKFAELMSKREGHPQGNEGTQTAPQPKQ